MEDNLKELYPLSKRWILQRVVLCFVLLFSILFGIYELEYVLNFENTIALYRKTFIYGMALSLIFITYSILYHISYKYKLIGDELIIKKGVILIKPVGIPISKINAIHIQRGIHEIIFGISTVMIVVPGDIHTGLSSISGLSLKNAEALKAHIFREN